MLLDGTLQYIDPGGAACFQYNICPLKMFVYISLTLGVKMPRPTRYVQSPSSAVRCFKRPTPPRYQIADAISLIAADHPVPRYSPNLIIHSPVTSSTPPLQLLHTLHSACRQAIGPWLPTARRGWQAFVGLGLALGPGLRVGSSRPPLRWSVCCSRRTFMHRDGLR